MRGFVAANGQRKHGESRYDAAAIGGRSTASRGRARACWRGRRARAPREKKK
jgi:hypothetical protein